MSEVITLRPAEPGDAKALAGLWEMAFPLKFGHVFGEEALAFLREWLQRDPALYAGTTLACAGAKVAGYIQIEEPIGQSLPSYIVNKLPEELAHVPALISVGRKQVGLARGLLCMLRLAIMDQRPDLDDSLYIHMIGVDKTCRGQGIGSRLLEFAAAEARAKGFKQLTLGVVSENTGAIRLYERHGFVAGPERRNRLFGWASGSPSYRMMAKEIDQGDDQASG